MAKRVILVDDSRTILATFEMALEDLVGSGAIILDVFNDPLQFLEEIKNKRITYDLLFTDINMPQINGLDLAKELKSIEHVKQKPIVALTTESHASIKQAGKEIGIAGWLVKPFSDAKVIGAVQKILAL